jgi:anaerobic selenocysteine-containing dehydrogenase
MTGRVKDQWHTRTRTGKVPKLNRSEPRPFLEVHPDDARIARVSNGQLVRVVSRRGHAEIPARVTSNVAAGTVFAPFHWGGLWSEQGTANRATSEALDPRSRQPELKFAAVRLERV